MVNREDYYKNKIKNNNNNWITAIDLEDFFEWENSVKTNFIDLFEMITLHDSYWKNKIINDQNELILIIEFDSHWNNEYLGYESRNADWPYLIIKIPKMMNIEISTNRNSNTILISNSIVIPRKKIKKWIEMIDKYEINSMAFRNKLKNAKEVYKTTIYDLKGYVQILHEPEIWILIIDKEGNYVTPNKKSLNPMEKSSLQQEESFFRRIINYFKK